MRWSFRIGRIFGIEFRIHVAFLILLFFVFVAGALSKQGSPQKGAMGVLFLCSIFACVLIHEIGHSLIGRRFGKEAKSITLLPIGGVATMEEMPEKPGQEIAMAIMGPFINLAIAGALYLAVGQKTGVGAPHIFPNSAAEFLAGLIGANVVLAIFNMVPAFPMDGGRVFRGLLALKLDYVQATTIAATVGQALAMVFVFFGLFFNLFLALIGIFLYMGAGSEKRQVVLRTALHGVPASQVMVTDFRVLRPDELLSQVMEHIFHGCQPDFPVVGDEGLEGILTRKEILSSIHEKGLDVQVREVMDRDFLRFPPETSLEDVYRRLVSADRTAAAVIGGGELKGIISLDGISRYFMIRDAMR